MADWVLDGEYYPTPRWFPLYWWPLTGNPSATSVSIGPELRTADDLVGDTELRAAVVLLPVIQDAKEL